MHLIWFSYRVGTLFSFLFISPFPSSLLHVVVFVFIFVSNFGLTELASLVLKD